MIGNKINFAYGIKTVRWHKGRFNEVEENYTNSDEENNDENGRSVFGNGQNGEDDFDDGSLNDFSNSTKSRKALNTVVNDNTEIGSISNLKRVALILLVSLTGLAFADFFLMNMSF